MTVYRLLNVLFNRSELTADISHDFTSKPVL